MVLIEINKIIKTKKNVNILMFLKDMLNFLNIFLKLYLLLHFPHTLADLPPNPPSRFTAKGIINTLFTRDEIKAKRPYVKFLWNKFVVNTNGLNREYNYNETFFINSLIASFQCFAETAQETINKFCSEELNDDCLTDISSANIDKIIELNKQNADIKTVDVED